MPPKVKKTVKIDYTDESGKKQVLTWEIEGVDDEDCSNQEASIHSFIESCGGDTKKMVEEYPMRCAIQMLDELDKIILD